MKLVPISSGLTRAHDVARASLSCIPRERCDLLHARPERYPLMSRDDMAQPYAITCSAARVEGRSPVPSEAV